MKNKTNKGVQGSRVKFIPEKVESMLASDSLIQRGKVIGAGPKSKCKVGDMIVVSDWMVERVMIEEEMFYYVSEEAVLEII